MASLLLTILLAAVGLLSLSAAAAVPGGNIRSAADVLSDSGYLSMSLTFELLSTTTIPQSPTLTIFAPSDSAFTQSGQPSLTILQFHFSPFYFPLRSLKSLSFGSKIPTFFANHSLVVTPPPPSDGGDVSLNGVKINGSPIYDDGSLIIFGMDEFFDPGFGVQGVAPAPGGSNSVGCSAKAGGVNGSFSSFNEATGILRSNGYSIMASFLGLQLVGFMDHNLFFTVFAPADEVLMGFAGNFVEFPSILLRHVLPCKVSWSDLVNFNDGVVLETYMDGFEISVSRSGNVLLLNKVPVSSPEIYQNDWLVVHGLQRMLEAPERFQGLAPAAYSPQIGSLGEDSIFEEDGEF